MTNLNLIPFAVLGALLAVVVIVLIVYRQRIAHQADESLHVLEGVEVADRQISIAHRLEHIDRWGKTLTVLTIVYAVAIALVFAYQQFVAETNLLK